MCEIGEVFTGHCDGFFGRDSYGEKRVEGSGADWIVAREADGVLCFACFVDRKEKDEYVREWREVKNS